MKAFLVSYIINEIKYYTSQSLHITVKAVDSKTTIQCNIIIQLEKSMLMYGVYNAETLEKLVDTITRYTTLHLHMKDYMQDNRAY